MISKKKIVIAVIFIFILSFCSYMFWPMTLNSIIFHGEPVFISFIENKADNGVTSQTSYDYVFEYDSDEYRQLFDILDKYPYHRGLYSFTGDISIPKAGRTVTLYSSGNLIVLGCIPKIIVNEKAYRLGYFNKEIQTNIIDEICNLLPEKSV